MEQSIPVAAQSTARQNFGPNTVIAGSNPARRWMFANIFVFSVGSSDTNEADYDMNDRGSGRDSLCRCHIRTGYRFTRSRIQWYWV